MRTILPVVIGATLALCAVKAGAQAVPGDRQVALVIESKTLADALDQWAQQSGFQILLKNWDMAKKLTAPSLKGTFSAQAALEQLLSGTPLVYEFTSERTVTVRARVTAASQTTGSVDHVDVPRLQLSQMSASEEGSGRSRVLDAGASSTTSSTATLSRDALADRGDIDELEEVVVTGTHIRGAAPTGSSLTVYQRTDIDRSGASNVEQFLRTIPQNFSSLDASTSQVTAGGISESNTNSFFGSAVNLRGLGGGATLVLLNGQRLAPAGTDGAFVDVSMIPLSAVERIEVVTDGASAIYGADAVAGVVNFILRKDYEGAETIVRFGDSTRGGAAEIDASQLLGGSWKNGNAMLVYEHRKQDPLLARQRDFVPISAEGASEEFTLLPEDRINSVFVTGRQSLAANTRLFANGFWSNRDFSHASVALSGLTETYITGETQHTGASITLEQGLPSQWNLDVIASQSSLRQQAVQRDVAFSQIRPFDYDSAVASLDMRANGPLFSVLGGQVRASIGVGGRREEFGAAATETTSKFDLDRDVFSTYGEILIPLIGAENTSGLQRLDLSMAARYDRYDDFGSATEPKVGVAWRASQSITFRGNYARSFRAPSLSQRYEQNLYQLISIPSVVDPDGYIHTIFKSGSGNDQLGPERSRSFSLGLDLKSQSMPGLSVSATYFDVDFSDRIAGPPLVGSSFDIYDEPAVAPFIDRSVDLAEVDRIVNEEVFFNSGGPDFTGIDPQLTEAFFDEHPRNIAHTQESGVDLSANYSFGVRSGTLGLFLAGTKLLKLDYQVTSTTPAAELFDKTFRPMDLRLRGGASWGSGGLAGSVILNYASGYENNLLTPTGRVDSWLTADLQLRYETSEGSQSVLLRGTTLALSILNATDEDPPSVHYGAPATDFNYDSSNASPRGRFISLQLGKRW